MTAYLITNPPRVRQFRERGTTGAVVVTTGDHVKRAVLNFRQAVDGRIPVTGVVARG